MNYPCLRCIVEYLEANQRFLLSSNCPSIRKAERSIPLHLDRLEFRPTTITINQFDYKLKKNVVANNEGREQLSNHYHIARSLYFAKNRNEEEIMKNFPEEVPLDSAMKWMGCFFFEGRRVVTTKRLEVAGRTVLHLPIDFKIRVTGRLNTTMSSLDGVSKFILPKLEELAIFGLDDIVWKNCLIRSARQVYMRFRTPRNVENFLNCTHKNVMLYDSLPGGYFERLIRKWIADGKEIGFSFCFIEYEEQANLETLYNFKKMFAGRAVDRKVPNEEITLNETPIRDRWGMIESSKSNKGRKLLYCICLPMNSTSELQISLFGENPWRKGNKIDLEVVPVESSPTLRFDHVEFQFKKEAFMNSLSETAGALKKIFDAIIIFLGILFIFSEYFLTLLNIFFPP